MGQVRVCKKRPQRDQGGNRKIQEIQNLFKQSTEFREEEESKFREFLFKEIVEEGTAIFYEFVEYRNGFTNPTYKKVTRALAPVFIISQVDRVFFPSGNLRARDC